ncbi:MAG: hypothetical protein ACYC1C_00965 [Chloroflexota bacterium]
MESESQCERLYNRLLNIDRRYFRWLDTFYGIGWVRQSRKIPHKRMTEEAFAEFKSLSGQREQARKAFEECVERHMSSE